MSTPSPSRPSFTGRTPESTSAGLRRKDSRHALTTCHGITTNGRACRRGITARNSKYTIKGTLLVPHTDQDPAVFFCHQHKDQADELVKKSKEAADGVESVDVEERTSLETVFRNLGLEEVGEEDEHVEVRQSVGNAGEMVALHTPTRMHRKAGSRTHLRQDSNRESPRRTDFDDLSSPRKSVSRRSLRQNTNEESPRVAEVDDMVSPKERRRSKHRRSSSRKQSPPKSGGLFSMFTACWSPSDVSKVPPARPRYDRHASQPSMARTPKDRSTVNLGDFSSLPTPQSDRFAGATSGNSPELSSAHSRKDSGVSLVARDRRKSHDHPRGSSQQLIPQRKTPRRKSETLRVYRDDVPVSPPYQKPRFANSDLRHPVIDRKPLNLRSQSSPESQTAPLQFWTPDLPRNASDTVRICYAKLLTCMSEKPTARDDEGYIYMFWQTELPTTEAETDAAASIVNYSPSKKMTSSDEEILQRRFFQTSANATLPAVQKRKLFLKIGRAANVHQRMGQWQKQCGYNVSLLRYYPQPEEVKDDPVKIKYVGKVERLVHLHLEMLGYRVKKECRCGTEHREWFEIEATPKAVREMDNMICKWVAWCQDKYSDA